MTEETPEQRIRLIEGRGLLNDEKLSEEERKLARSSAMQMIRRIEQQNEYLLVKDSSMTIGQKASALATIVGIMWFILTHMH